MRSCVPLTLSLELGAGGHQHDSWTLGVGEDASRNASLEADWVEVEGRRVFAALLGQFKQIELVVRFPHLALPVVVVMVALVPEELLIEEFW